MDGIWIGPITREELKMRLALIDSRTGPDRYDQRDKEGEELWKRIQENQKETP